MFGDRRSMIGPALLVTLAGLVGCGGKDRPETVKVFGKVTHAGQPVTSGTVTFHPVGFASGEANRPALGVLQPDGSYALSTYEAGDGAIPGKYEVAVVSVEKPPSVEEFAAGAKVKPALPEKYATPRTSGLTATVPAEADAPVEINFDLDE